MTVLRHYKMTAAEDRATDLHAALVDLAVKVTPLPGCEKVELFADPKDGATFVFVEHWRSIEDHEAAGAALGKHAFAPVAATLSAPPEGRYLEPIPLG
ncbi:MAG: antibiotic biosynthesis monooxygenase family protein [Sphingomonas sp.]|jgi:quinol monooxygenase YgiN|uniref:putative quinol monooxygenase n=1 Tax=Sphingomonas sp. TaxID=28214 RepID=UPI0035631B42